MVQRLMQEMGGFDPSRLNLLSQLEPLGYPAAFTCASVCWGVSAEASLAAMLWSWAENQVSVAMKTIPIGQVAGQQILAELAALLPELGKTAKHLPDEAISSFCPMFAIASSQHETQYSRLFRS